MKRWHNEVGDMLAYVNDVLVPHGFEDIEKGRFRGLARDAFAASLIEFSECALTSRRCFNA